ncbi:MAG TPA: hypothetical protein PK919_03895 [Candidatus Aminicenantes bacterium]|nr:hypothetical protein [Candidatus Aminicenantes bacterium]
MLLKKKKTESVTAEWTGEYRFRVTGGRHALECGVVIRTTVAAGVFWEARIIKVLSGDERVATGQMHYRLALPAGEAVRRVRAAARLLGFRGKVHVYAMDGMLLLS